MAVFIQNEAQRCLNCKKPMCREGCPIHTPIPNVIQLFKEHKLMEAGEMLFENNPMSLICATVCNHEQQCMGHCVLGRKGNPVIFPEIEKFVSDAYLDRMKVTKNLTKGKRAAVIGGGPAGMTVAICLAKAGYNVTIFEAKDKIGGVMQYGIPEFRLSKTVLTRYKKKMLKMGIQVRPDTTIGGALTIEELFRDGYASVFIGTGVWRPKTLGIHGESLGNVHFGIDYLSNPGAHDVGENVAVIGMGNVAVDVARTVLRNGALQVTMYSRDATPAASSHELAYAQMDGVGMVFGKIIERITTEGPVLRTALQDENGVAYGATGEEEQIHADSTIICISQGPKDKLLHTTQGLTATEKGLLVVDENLQTTRAGVFAAGDVVTGAKTVVHAVADAKRAAQSMIDYMEGNLAPAAAPVTEG